MNTKVVQEIKPPRGAILSVDKLIARTAGGGVVYGVWILGPTTTIERLTDARRHQMADVELVERQPDGTLVQRMGRGPTILIRSLDDELEPELRPVAHSALNLDGPVYRPCFVFSLKDQADAFIAGYKPPTQLMSPPPSPPTSLIAKKKSFFAEALKRKEEEALLERKRLKEERFRAEYFTEFGGARKVVYSYKDEEWS